MSTNSNIEWTDTTWNPVVGCTRVSAGCDNCYAVTMTHRLEKMGQAKYAGLTVLNPRGDRHFNGTVRCVPEALALPLSWRKPRRVFVNSMSDLFHKEVPFDFIDRVFAVMALCPQHTFQVLTKRPERMAEYFNDPRRGGYIWHEATEFEPNLNDAEHAVDWAPKRSNVWLGTSCENQATADERIPHLLRCPAQVRFLSCEPLLGAIDLRRYVNGETTWDREQDEHLHSATFDTAERPNEASRQNTLCGRQCTTGAEIPTTNGLADMADGESRFASGGATSRSSDPTWVQGRRPHTPSNESTTTGTTSPATAAGLSEASNRGTSRTPASSRREDAHSHLVSGSGRQGSTGARSQGVSTADGLQRTRSAPEIHWVIVGGESGSKARPCDVAWIRSIVGQCRDARVPCFVKQLGSRFHDAPNGIAGRALDIPPEGMQLLMYRLCDTKGGDPAEWPQDLRVREMPEDVKCP